MFSNVLMIFENKKAVSGNEKALNILYFEKCT